VSKLIYQKAGYLGREMTWGAGCITQSDAQQHCRMIIKTIIICNTLMFSFFFAKASQPPIDIMLMYIVNLKIAWKETLAAIRATGRCLGTKIGSSHMPISNDQLTPILGNWIFQYSMSVNRREVHIVFVTKG